MGLEEAYKVFFGDNSQELSKEVVKQRYRRLVSEFHPDSHSKRSDEESMKDVNLAYEILLEHCDTRKPPKQKKVSKPLSSSEIDLERIGKYYQILCYKAMRIREYKIKGQLYSNTECYYYMMANCKNILEMLSLYKKYQEISHKSRLELAEVSRYYSNVSQKIKSKKFSEEDLEDYLNRIIDSFYNYLIDSKLEEKVERWYNEEKEKDEKIYNRQHSEILNIKNKLYHIINLVVSLNEIATYEILNQRLSKGFEGIDSSDSVYTKLEIYKELTKEEERIKQESQNWISRINELKLELDNSQSKEIDQEFISRLEAEIVSRMPKKSLDKLLFEEDITKPLNKKLKQSASKYRRNYLKLNLIFRKIDSSMKHINNQYIKVINEINQLFLKQEKRELAVKNKIETSKNGSTEKTYRILNKTLENSLKEALTLYYRYFICYYQIVYGQSIPDDLDKLFKEINKDTSPSRIEEIYQIISLKYQNLMNLYQNKNSQEFILMPDNEKNTRKILISSIMDLLPFVQNYYPTIADRYQGIENLSKLSLTKLYQINQELQQLLQEEKITKPVK